MFNSQNKNFNSAKTQPDSVEVATLPIHTMEKDLKNINNANFNATDFMPEEEIDVKKEIFESKLSEKQKSSPFLNPSQSKPIAEIQYKSPKSAAQIEKKVASQTKIETKEEFNIKKVAFFAVSILIVLSGIAAAYYFISNRDVEDKAANSPEISTSPLDTNITPAPNNNPSESTPLSTEPEKINIDKPNFLVIDSQVKDKAAIQEIINNKITDIKAAKIYTPVEFAVTDGTFAPLTFQFFSQTLGLALPTNITDNFKTTFSLFINNPENGQTGIALLIDIKDGKTLVPILSKEEPQLVKELDPLFLGKTYQIKTTPFLTNNYKNTTIRYYNIQTDGSMSCDYAILNNQLLLATSKSAALNTVDKLLAK